jgi:uncharacterized SAM-binding protein YcdF (DUF218 family)
MNSLFALLGIDAWKPVVTALLLPPVPMLVLIFVGTCYIPQRRLLGWLLVLLAMIGLWLSCCTGVGNLMITELLRPPQALSREELSALKAEVKAKRAVTVVVVGGGRADYAPEYGVSSLTQHSLERLRYGLWLGKKTGAPVGFSGGRGWSQAVGPPESEVADRIAEREFGRPLDWTEEESSDTRQIARLTVVLLKRMHIKRAILVTHDWHMPRALWLFTEAAGDSIMFQPAPLALSTQSLSSDVLDWLPTGDGYTKVRHVLRELLARLAGT